jgi:hypothetical protein
MASNGGYSCPSGSLDCPHAWAMATLAELLHNFYFVMKTVASLNAVVSSKLNSVQQHFLIITSQNWPH